MDTLSSFTRLNSSSTMILISTAFLLLCASLSAEQSVSKVAFTESQDVIQAFSPSGEITLPVIRVQLEIHHASGKSERGDLVVVHDPVSGHYFWLYTRPNNAGDTASWLTVLKMKSGGAAVYAASGGLAFFNMAGDLFAQERRVSAPTLEGAESSSIEEIRRGLAEFELNGYDPGLTWVHLFRAIGREFACAPDDEGAYCIFGARKFVSIAREGNNWLLIARNRWDQEIILDSKFSLVGTRRVPDPPKYQLLAPFPPLARY
ncbi:MAG TPA: hypothetical protein VNU44_06565 [Bryobacteraceae bacterium]|nr:hypothetical protein [Bryobacteraceae bacterium]